MDCPICRANETSLRHAGVPEMEHCTGYVATFHACRRCGVLFQHPQPSRQTLRAMYVPEYRAQNRYGIYGFLKRMQGHLQARQLRRYIPTRGSRILELGCGAGYLLSALGHTGFTDLCGVDWRISEDLRRSAPSINFIEDDITTFVPSRPVDIILINNVLEHVADPGALLEHCRTWLRRPGRIILVTPNAESIGYNVFGRFWSGLHSPWHVFIFTARSLSILTERTDYRTRSIARGEDTGSWGISLQNAIRSVRTKPRAVAKSGYGVIALIGSLFCLPVAVAAKLLGRGSSLTVVIETATLEQRA